MYHCDNWRIKNQLDATCYFIVFLTGSTCFGHYYAHHQELATYLLTPWCRVLLEKLAGLQLVKKFPAFQGTPKVHYRTHKRPPTVPILGQPNPVHIPTSHLLEIHPNIIHPSTPRSPQWSLSLRFPHQDPIRPPLLTHTRHMPSPSHSPRFYLLNFINYLMGRSQWPRGLRRGSAAARVLGLRVWIPPGVMDVCLEWLLCVVK